MSFEFEPEVDGVDLVEESLIREKVWARYQKLGRKLSLEERLLMRRYVAGGFEGDDPEFEAEFLLETAYFLMRGQPTDGQVVHASDLTTWAHECYQEGGVSQGFWDGMVERYHDTIWNQMVACHSRARQRVRAEDDPANDVAMLYTLAYTGQILKDREWGAPKQLAWAGYHYIRVAADFEDEPLLAPLPGAHGFAFRQPPAGDADQDGRRPSVLPGRE